MAKMRFSKRKFCTPARTYKQRMHLMGGPMSRHTLYVYDTSCTRPFTLKGQTGRYVQGIWQEASRPVCAAPEITRELETA